MVRGWASGPACEGSGEPREKGAGSAVHVGGLARGTGPGLTGNPGGGPGSEAACPAHKYLAFSQRQTQLYFGSGRLQGGLGHFPYRLGPQPLALGLEGTRVPRRSGSGSGVPGDSRCTVGKEGLAGPRGHSARPEFSLPASGSLTLFLCHLCPAPSGSFHRNLETESPPFRSSTFSSLEHSRFPGPSEAPISAPGARAQPQG